MLVEPRLGSQPVRFQLRDIYGGAYDSYIRSWAAAAKAWGKPFFLRFDHEQNGWWYPWGEGKLSTGAIVNGNSAGDFVKAWRHVHDLFVQAGATNVSWVWSPNQVGDASRYPTLSSLYPGDAYVDWTALSVYNKYGTWLGPLPAADASGQESWLQNSYQGVVNAAPSKPMMLAEWGSYEAGDGGTKKAAWFKDALGTQIQSNFPKVKAVVYYNDDGPNNNETLPIESSSLAQSAFASAIGSSYYTANTFSTITASPIAPPGTLHVIGHVRDGQCDCGYVHQERRPQLGSGRHLDDPDGRRQSDLHRIPQVRPHGPGG